MQKYVIISQRKKSIYNDFASVVDGFMKMGEECGFKANIQREEIFDKMHRI